MKRIEGQKVILRPATLQNRRQIFEWLTQSNLTASMMGPPIFTEVSIPTWEKFVNDYNLHFFDDEDPDSGRSYIIEVNRKAVGHINNNEINRSTNTVELDIRLASSKHCHKGYGSDAINSLCQYLTDNLNCEAFILATSARNKAAIRVYEKLDLNLLTNSPTTSSLTIATPLS